MTEQQKNFCAFYQQGCSPKEAAVKAGYSRSGAVAAAKRLLGTESIKNYLSRAPNEDLPKIADNDEILAFLTTVLRSNDESVAVRDKMRAAELLGKNLSLFSEGKDGYEPVKIFGEENMND